jgi:UDP-2,4-diacetamido-2,4,6-trideoxy-beta-L-altropyranose hydrolase
VSADHPRLRLLFFADSGPLVGLGHVMRSFTLATAAARAGHHVLFCAAVPTFLLKQGADISIDMVPPNHFWMSFDSFAPQVVVLDGYKIDHDIFNRATDLGSLIVKFDDSIPVDLDTGDIVINTHPSACSATTGAATNALLLGGLKFVQIREGIRKVPSGEQPLPHGGPPTDQVLVAFGGTDATGLTESVVSSLLASFAGTLVVSFGTMNPSNCNVRDRFIGNERIEVVEPADFADALARVDLAVIGAGTTLWEAAFLGVPVVAVVVADNQAPQAFTPEVESFASVLDFRAQQSVASLVDECSRLLANSAERNRRSVAGRKLVDGFGAERVIDAIASVQGEQLMRKNPVL